MDLQGLGAVVTGGASGLGEATARMLVEKGAKVTLFDLAEERGAEVAASLGESARFARVNVTSEEDVKAALEAHVAFAGAVHLVVNCAGVATPSKVLDREGNATPLANFKKVVEINLVGSFNVVQQAAVFMAKNEPNAGGERGVVVNTASVAAFDGQIGQAAYSSSKGAIAALTLPLAREFSRYGVRVMTIAPGIFMTPMMAGLPEKAQASLAQQVPFPSRLGNPSEYAQLVCHIVENAMLNGEVIRLDGALRMAAK
ncbi:MAG: 3-hydroxyacyl-CoA dehydrogenase [Myxococcales bacterium]|nr:3-hydroxyacyl-CoA dehydrogenase [Myxococcales bacterium]